LSILEYICKAKRLDNQNPKGRLYIKNFRLN